MKISEALNKSNPVIQQRETNTSEYMKLVDANVELVNQLNELKETINKTIEYIEYKKGLFTKDVVQIKVIEDLLEILKGE